MPKAKRTAPEDVNGEGKGRGKKVVPVEELPILHPEIRVELLLGEEALTAEQAKDMLGWEEEPAHLKWGDDYTLTDQYSRKVRCNNNSRNRPFTDSWAKALCFDILNRNWADSRNGPDRTVNGETIIIGRYGSVLSAQHRLIGLVLARQYWELTPPGGHWKEVWGDTPPSMEALVVYGVDESPATVRTLDNTRPRSLEDVFVTEGNVFGRSRGTEREALCKVLGTAAKWVWDRTGAKDDSFHPHKTHSEMVDFCTRHPRLVQACKHVWDLNKRKKTAEGTLPPFPIGRFLNPGVAAALLYLMGTASTDGQLYWSRPVEERSDGAVKWGSWKQAQQFWSDLAGDRLPEIAQAIASLSGQDGEYEVGPAEKRSVICKAWNLYREEKPLVVEDVIPETEMSEVTGKRVVTEPITVGGIDQGTPEPKRKGKAEVPDVDDEDEDDEDEDTDESAESAPTPEEGVGSPASMTGFVAEFEVDDPTPEQIEAETLKAREQREAEKEKRKEARKQALKDRNAQRLTSIGE